MPQITPNLWFDTQGEEAAELYTSVFPSSRITDIARYGPAGPGPEGEVMTVAFELDGKPFVIINGGPQFPQTEAVSFEVTCEDQAEVDYYWDKLIDGGEESQCGWLKDRYGVSWQIVPRQLNELLTDPDAGRSQRAMEAMLGMVKIDVAELQRAADAA